MRAALKGGMLVRDAQRFHEFATGSSGAAFNSEKPMVLMIATVILSSVGRTVPLQRSRS
jgi:hypothetical protein